MMLSLVQTSQNRRQELIRFINSLNNQIGIDFSQIQLIFIDQGNNKIVFNQLNPQIKFVYLQHKPCSLSVARNYGLQYIKGKYVAFPDDDCWYEPDTLKKVLEAFSEGHIGVIAKGTDEKGILTNDFPLERQYITLYNHCGAISYTMFFKYIPSLKFDENIGIGSPFKLSSGEETDYLMQVIYKNGANIIFDPSIIVHHPNFNYCNFKDNFVKQYEYARGWGYILKKHHFPFSVKCKSFIRPLCGILFGVLTLNFARMKHSSYLLIGRIEGYNFKAENNGKISIIVPVYNVSKYLKRSLDSLINQTLKDLEIIIVNDGSTDNSLDICQEYASLDNRIKVISKENGGLSSARNYGLRYVTSDYVAFIDSDDYIALDMFETMYGEMQNNICDTIFCNFYI